MTRRDTLSLALKVLGIYWLIYSLQGIGPLIMNLSGVLEAGAAGAMAGTAAVLLVVSLILVFGSGPIARRLDPGEAGEGSRWTADREGVREVAFCVLGLFAILKAVPSIGNWLAMRYWPASADERMFARPMGMRLVGPLLLLLLGLALFLGSRPIRKLFSRVWEMGSRAWEAGRVEGLPGKEPPEGPDGETPR